MSLPVRPCCHLCKNCFLHQLTGFTGQNCEENLDDCPGNSCKNGGTCVDGVNTYNCQCLPEWTGKEFRRKSLRALAWNTQEDWVQQKGEPESRRAGEPGGGGPCCRPSLWDRGADSEREPFLQAKKRCPKLNPLERFCCHSWFKIQMSLAFYKIYYLSRLLMQNMKFKVHFHLRGSCRQHLTWSC